MQTTYRKGKTQTQDNPIWRQLIKKAKLKHGYSKAIVKTEVIHIEKSTMIIGLIIPNIECVVVTQHMHRT